MSALKSVIIALPKGLTKAPGGAIATGDVARNTGKFNLATSILADKAKIEGRKLPKQLDVAPEDGSLFKQEACLRGKKRRLDHLTWEEKLQRKKLKNRVAAQTSRDRKKAKLDELEDTVRSLKDRNDMLMQECAALRSQNDTLVMEMKRLRRERDVGSSGQQFCSLCQSRVGCAVPSLGSAVSPQNPLPQGGTAQSAPSLTLTPGTAVLLRILTLYLLSKSSSAIYKEKTTSSDSKSSPRVFLEKLPPRWKQILVDQATKLRSRKIPLRSLSTRKEWWGRHQKTWKPVQPMTA